MIQEDLNALLDLALSMGCDALESQGYSHPFAVTFQHDDSAQFSGELSEEEKQMDPEKLVAQFHAMLASGCKQGLHKAIAVGQDVKVMRFKSEGYVRALEVQIEHEDGYAAQCFLPYKIGADKKISYGTIFSTVIDPIKFSPKSK